MDELQELAAVRLGPVTLGRLFSALVIFVVCFVAIRILTYFLRKAFRRSKRLNPTLRGFLTGAVKTVLWVLAAIIIADSLGISTTSLVAAVSVVGLALSLSIQSVMSNLFSGVTLLMTRPFEAGDYVEISGKVGTVQSVGLFYTTLDTLENLRVSIPNADVTAAAVINYSAEPVRQLDLTYTAVYDAPTAVVKTALLEAAEAAISEADFFLSEPAPAAAILAFQDSRISYSLRLWFKAGNYWAAVFLINEKVRDSFERHGVEMGYDRQDVRVIND